MKIIDLFSGVGGLSLGFEDAGFQSVAAIDIWQDAINTFNHNRQEKTGICSDVRTFNDQLRAKRLSFDEVTGIIGGPPCQGFSSARLSSTSKQILEFNKYRNQLYCDFLDTVKLLTPEFFVLENVRGILSADNGKVAKAISADFEACGYHVTTFLLNAKDFGVPQSRFRAFFVGSLSAKLAPPPPINKTISSLDAISDLANPSSDKPKYSTPPTNSYQKLMRRSSLTPKNHEPTVHSEKTTSIISQVPDGGNIKSLPPEYWEVRKYNKAFQRMNSSKPANTVDTGHRNYFHYSENRIPTARENARLQSFPDSFEFLGSKTSHYRQIGNAVPPILARAVATQIKSQL